MKSPEKKQFSFAVRAQLAFWVVLFFFMVLSGVSYLNLTSALYRAFLVLVCHAINFYVSFSWLTPRYFEKKKYGHFAVGSLLLLSALTPLRILVGRLVASQTLPLISTRAFPNISGRGFVLLVVFSEITLGCFALLLRMAIDNYASKRRIVEMEKIQLETEQLRLEIELKFLKSQMSPHFLFNTINNVYALSMMKSNRTPDMLLKLSGLLRYLLYECQWKVPVSREVVALRSYIELFQLRYEEPLNIRMNSATVEGEDGGSPVIEPMLLIPLLENAIKHSAVGVVTGAFVDVVLDSTPGMLIARLTNSIAPVFPGGEEEGGIGLQNIRKRLESIYPDNNNLIISQTHTNF